MIVALEGPDGVGKSSVARALVDALPAALSPCVRHFPSSSLTDKAKAAAPLCVEDYIRDMVAWVHRNPVTPTPDTVYVLDRWVLSTQVYAGLRGERIPERWEPFVKWLWAVPAVTFVLLPDDPGVLSDPDYPDPGGYDPVRVTAAYEAALAHVPPRPNPNLTAEPNTCAPVRIVRGVDTPESVAADITNGLRVGYLTLDGVDLPKITG